MITLKMKPKNTSDKIDGAFAAGTFAIILIIAGVPIWWFTTSVYRASLPYSTIESLRHDKNSHKITVTVIGDGAKEIADALKIHLTATNGLQFVFHSRELSLLEKNTLSQQTLELVDLKFNDVYKVPTGELSVVILPHDKSRVLGDDSIVVGLHRFIYVKHKTDAANIAVVLDSLVLDPVARERTNSVKPSTTCSEKTESWKEALRQVSADAGYDLTFTIMVPEPQWVRPKWQPLETVKKYWDSLVHQVEDIVDINIRSQVLYMTRLSVVPKWSAAHGYYVLSEAQLPLMINAIETKLGSFVSTRPCINFIIYVPDRNQSPMHIHAKNEKVESNSFLLPRWGGLMIHNMIHSLNDSVLTSATIREHWIMQTVFTQLHQLLPIPQVADETGVKVLSSSHSTNLALWQVDGLARSRITSHLDSIQISLQSLSELVGEIGNMVISDEVADCVWSAVDDWQACKQASQEGRLAEATSYCKQAFTKADVAFFHPSMLSLLYFPDNQKYAIYVPLFLPVGIPVFLSFKLMKQFF